MRGHGLNIRQNLDVPTRMDLTFLLFFACFDTLASTAGQDATDAFFGLHRHEVLLKPNYARLQIGMIKGEQEQITAPQPGQISRVPYAEAPWLTPGK